VIHFTLHLLIKSFFTSINISLLTLKIPAEKHVNLHVKCLLFLPEFNQNWNVPTNFVELFEHQFYENPFTDSSFVLCLQSEAV
jgi:hypothetical protein